MFVSKARTHNEKMMKIYAQNYTLPTTQPTRRFNNPFLIQSSQVLLSQILKKQSSTSTPTVKPATDLNPVNDETSNIETQADSTKATEAKKDMTKTKTKAKTKADAKAKADAKTAQTAKAKEIQDNFNKTVAAQKARADAKTPDATAQTSKAQKDALDSISKKIKESTDQAEKANLNSQKILIQDSSTLKEAEAKLKQTTDPKKQTALKAIIEQKKESVKSLKKSIKKYNTENTKTERKSEPGYLNAEIVGQLNRDDLLTSSGIDSRDGFFIYPGLTSKQSKKYNDNLAIRQEKFKSFKAFKLKASEESVKPKTSKVRKEEDKGAAKTIENLRKAFIKADAVLDDLINKSKANKPKANKNVVNPMGKKQGTTRPLTDEASSLEKGRHSGLRGGN